MKKKIKHFLGPNWKIVLIKIILLVPVWLVWAVNRKLSPLEVGYSFGWPLQYIEYSGIRSIQFDITLLVLRVLFWYLVICLIFFVLNKLFSFIKRVKK